MEIVALMGPIDPNAIKIIKNILEKNFKIIEVRNEEDLDQLKTANYVILRTLSMNANLIESIPKLKLIQRWGVGYESVDIVAAGKRNVRVTITSGINSIPVSEFTIMLMLSVYRKVIQLHNNVIKGYWRDEDINSKSYLINGKIVGLIGLGSIGLQVVPKVKAFGAEVQYFDINRLTIEDELKLGIRYLDFDNLICSSDIISIHVPLTKETKHLIRRDTLEKMKKNAVIINTSRGEIINEDDLIEALISQRILGAGLDVFEHEPLIPTSRLTRLDNVVLTPHSGGNTNDNNFKMAERCADNILRVSKGLSPASNDLVNAEYFT